MYVRVATLGITWCLSSNPIIDFCKNNPRCALRIVEETSSSRYLALEKLLLRDDSARWVSLSPAITGFN